MFIRYSTIILAILILTGCVSTSREDQDETFCYTRGYDVRYLDRFDIACVTPRGLISIGKIQYDEEQASQQIY
jgi:hypothetical protein